MRCEPSERVPAASKRCDRPGRRVRAGAPPRPAAALPPRDQAASSRRLRPATAQMGADGDILEHRHAGKNVDVLKGAPDAAPCDLRAGQAVDALAAKADLAVVAAASTPVIRLNTVLLPAPLGPIRPRISPLFMRERQVVHRPQGTEAFCYPANLKQGFAGCTVAFALATGDAAACRGCALPSREPAREKRHQTVARAMQQQDHQQAKHDDFVVAVKFEQFRQEDPSAIP